MMRHYASLVNRTKHIVMCKVYTDVSVIKIVIPWFVRLNTGDNPSICGLSPRMGGNYYKKKQKKLCASRYFKCAKQPLNLKYPHGCCRFGAEEAYIFCIFVISKLYTTLTDFSIKYLVMCKVYTDVGGIIFAHIKLVDYMYLLVQVDNQWY